MVGAVSKQVWARMADGREASLFVLRNAQGLCARVFEFGATLVSIDVPDRSGSFADVTLGFDAPAAWLANTGYFGSTVGRFANRIAHGAFELDGRRHSLALNNAPGSIPCHLHGGIVGFDKVLWHGTLLDHECAVVFEHRSPDGDEGYPGTLDVRVTYRLTDDNELVWEAVATTDRPTPVNLVHHSFWNLSGDPACTIEDHQLTLDADHYLPTNAGLIPTGEMASVAGTPMDFRQATAVGARIDASFEALRFGGGYDHCWVLRNSGAMVRAARLEHPKSGRVMEIFTDQPAIQFYAGNGLDGSVTGKRGVPCGRRSGLCLETEGFPDAPNHLHFPSCILNPYEQYRHRMVHRFTTAAG
jgi:aldose 1-epimerase